LTGIEGGEEVDLSGPAKQHLSKNREVTEKKKGRKERAIRDGQPGWEFEELIGGEDEIGGSNAEIAYNVHEKEKGEGPFERN